MSDIKSLMLNLKNKPCKETIDALVEELKKIKIYLPVAVKDNSDREAIKLINETHTIPKGTVINPAVVVTPDGKKFLSIFTSLEDFSSNKNYKHNYEGYIEVTFNFCMKLSTETKDIEAIAINPFTDNVILNVTKNLSDIDNNNESTHYIIRIRQEMEINILPYNIFNTKGFFKGLISEGANLLANMYVDLFKNKADKPSPYKPDDFDIMHLNISDEISVLRVSMPVHDKGISLAKRVYILYTPGDEDDSSYENMVYYAIVTGMAGKDDLFAIYPDGHRNRIGDAPEEVVEMNTVISEFKKYID